MVNVYLVNADKKQAMNLNTYINLFGNASINDLSKNILFWDHRDFISYQKETKFKILANIEVLNLNHNVSVTNYQTNINELNIDLKNLFCKYNSVSHALKEIKSDYSVVEQSREIYKQKSVELQRQLNSSNAKINDFEFEKLSYELTLPVTKYEVSSQTRLEEEQEKIDFLEIEFGKTVKENENLQKQIRNLKIEKVILDKCSKIKTDYELI